MSAIEAIGELLPGAARDLKINLTNVLQAESLTAPQRWGVAIASAIAARNPALRQAVLADAVAAGVEPATIDDARAAAALMGMNNVLYRARHHLGGDYEKMPARLRMQRIGAPAGPKPDFELMSLAVSAIHGCEFCLQAHEKAVVQAGLAPQAVLDAVRIAATMHGVACALEMD